MSQGERLDLLECSGDGLRMVRSPLKQEAYCSVSLYLVVIGFPSHRLWHVRDHEDAQRSVAKKTEPL